MNKELNLLLHMKHQGAHTLEECWMEGFHQASVEMGEEFNPYSKGSREADHWAQGWYAGFYGEEALYPEYAVGLPVELEDRVIERRIEEAEVEMPSYETVKNFLVMLGAVASTCVVATSLLS